MPLSAGGRFRLRPEEDEDKDKGRTGLLGLIAGKRGFDPLGLRSLGGEIGQIPAGLGNLAMSALPGGTPFGEAWSQAGKSFAGSLLSTASNPFAGAGEWNPVEMLGDKLLGKDVVQDFAERAGDRGFASALFEDLGNISLGGGALRSGLMRGGNAATKASVVRRASEKAGRAGLAPEVVSRAGQVGREAAGAGRYIGVRSPALRDAGIRGRLLTDVARSEGRLTRAGGTAAADAARGSGKLYTLADIATHPYLEAGRHAVRPLTRAAQRASVAGSKFTPPSVEERALAAAADLPGAEGGLDAPVQAGDFYEAQRRLGAQESAYDKVVAQDAAKRQGADQLADRLIALGATPPKSGAVRDRLLASKDAPLPEWAERAVSEGGRLHRARKPLAKAEGWVQRREAGQSMAESRRFMESERRKLFFSPAVRSSQAAADVLRTQFNVDPVQASRLVGDQLMAELDNRALLVAGRTLFPDDSVFEGMVQTAIGRKHRMTNAQLDAVRPLLDAALDEWRLAAGDRQAMLLGSPERGLRGLEGGVNFDPTDVDPIDGLSPSQKRLLNQKIREYDSLKQSDTVEGRAAKARERATLGARSKLDRAVAELERTSAALTSSQRAQIEMSLPAALQTAGRARTAARLTEIMGGGTYDPWTDSFVTAAEADAAVGVVGTKIDAAAWAADPEAALSDFIEKYATVLNDTDAKVGVWADEGSVYLDVTQTTADGRKLTREQANVLGMARGEKAVWDFATSTEAWLPQDATTRAVASLHAAEVMRPSSQFNRFLADVTRSRQQIAELQTQGSVAAGLLGGEAPIKVSSADWDDAVQRRMRIGATAVGSERFPSLDAFYGRMATEARKTQTDVPGAMLQVYLRSGIEEAMLNAPEDFQRALAQVGDSGQAALNWYYDSHDFVATRVPEGATIDLPRKTWNPDTASYDWTIRAVDKRKFIWSLLAATSVSSGALANAQTAFAGITNWSDFAGAMTKERLGQMVDALDDWQGIAPDVRRGAVEKKVGGALNPELMARELFAKVGATIPHSGRVIADVLDILTEKLVDEWDTAWLFERSNRPVPETRSGAIQALGIKTPQLEARIASGQAAEAELAAGKGPTKARLKRVQSGQVAAVELAGKTRVIPEDWDDLMARARSGDRAAEEKVTNLLGSKGYAEIRNFYANMSDPHKNRGVTLDRVMAQAYGLTSEDWSGVVYDQVVQMVSGLADDLSQVYGTEILPHQIQAIEWIATKQRIQAVEVGRRRSAMLDTADLFSEPADTLAEIFEAGVDPISRFYAEEIAQSGRGLQERPVDLVSEAGERTTETALISVSGGADAKALEEGAKKWRTRSAEIVTALEGGNKAEGQRLLDAWLAEEASAFANVGEYYSAFADAGKGRPKVVGVGTKGEGVADAARKHGYLGPEILPRSQPETAAGLRALTPDELADLDRRTAARWDRLTGDSGAAAFQRLGTDLAAGMTFLSDNTGRITERFFRTADPTTLLHEDAHMLRLILPPADIQKLLDAYPTRGQQATRAQRLTEGFGPEGFEEWFAEQAVRYFNTQQAPEGTAPMFKRVRDALASWWQGGQFEGSVDPTVLELLNRYLDPVGVTDIGAPELGRRLDVPASPDELRKFAASEQARPAETRQQALKRGLKLGREVQRSQDLAASLATQQARVARMERSFDGLADKLAETELPIEARKRKRLERLESQVEAIRTRADQPKSLASALPAHWMPLAGAVDELRSLAKQPGMEALADMMAEIPETLTGFLEWATTKGFDPTHVASIPEARVRDMVFGRFAPGDEALVAGTRKQRRQPFPQDRSIEALMAAHLDVVREAQTNQYVQTIRDSMAVRIGQDAEIPEGWVPWDEVQRFMGVATEDGVLKAVGPQAPRYMLPKPVADMMRHSQKNYDFGVLRGLRTLSSPWRAFVLTLSPRWYVNNAVGNLIMASAAGARPADWAKAWRSYRQGAHQGNWLRQRFGSGSDSFAGGPAQVTGDSNIVADIRGEAKVMGDELTFRQGRSAGRTRRASASGHSTRTLNRLQRANGVVDDLARVAVYFAEQSKGFSPDQALQQASRALVDYNDLGPVERSLVRSVVPFYGWMKGILKVTTRLAVDNPARAGLLWQLGKLNDELMAELPEWYRQTLNVPGVGGVNIRSLNPFSDASTLLSPHGIAASMNPFLEAVARSALDAPETGYPEAYRVDEFGRAMPDVDPVAGFGDILANLPQVGALGLGDGDRGGLGSYLGLPRVRDPEQLKRAAARLKKSESRAGGRSRERSDQLPPGPRIPLPALA